MTYVFMCKLVHASLTECTSAGKLLLVLLSSSWNKYSHYPALSILLIRLTAEKITPNPGTWGWKKQILPLLPFRQPAPMHQTHQKARQKKLSTRTKKMGKETSAIIAAPECFILQNYRQDKKIFTRLTFLRKDKVLLKMFSGICLNKRRCLNPLSILHL